MSTRNYLACAQLQDAFVAGGASTSELTQTARFFIEGRFASHKCFIDFAIV
jgi:hypothetical protein